MSDRSEPLDQDYPKVVRDGKVAVLISPGFGAGWYSWNRQYRTCLFDPEIVALVEANAPAHKIEAVAAHKWPEGYWDARDLTICWIERGSLFRIEDYDGNERLIFGDNEDYWTVA